MKTVVFGLFDDRENAQRVLTQLAKSPLDLDAIAIVHADADVQRSMAEVAGLPQRRGVLVGLVVGALAGGALGAWLGTDLLASLGPLLAAAAGVVIGGALGAAFTAFNESLKLPPEHAEALTRAVDDGATVVLVRSPSMPTARAIRDLFVAAGSVEIVGGSERPGSRGSGLMPVASHDAADDPTNIETGVSPGTAPPEPQREARPEGEEGHSMYAPPWRRTPASVRVPPGVSAVMESEDLSSESRGPTGPGPEAAADANPDTEPDGGGDVDGSGASDDELSDETDSESATS